MARRVRLASAAWHWSLARYNRASCPSAAPQTPATPAPAGSRIVAIGDVHGAFDQFVEILQAAGLIDAKRQWSGGTTVLVQTGDVFDRGPKVREALDLLMRLEEEAKRAGGRVESLLGNHEAMNLLHEFSDVAPADLCDVRRRASRNRAGSAPLTTTCGSSSVARRRAKPLRTATRGWPAIRRASWNTSTRSARAASTAGGCDRTRSSRREGGTAFMHAGVRVDMPRHVRRHQPHRGAGDHRLGRHQGDDGEGADRPAVLHAARGRRGRGRRAAADLGGTPGAARRWAITSRASSSSSCRRCSPSASRRCSNPRARSGSAGSRLWPETPESSDTQVTPLLSQVRRRAVRHRATRRRRRAGSCRASTTASS